MSRVARRRIRPRRSIIFLITSMVVVGLAFLVVLVFSSPDSFQAPQASMLKTAPERARLFERNFVSELTRIRKPQAEWGVRIRGGRPQRLVVGSSSSVDVPRGVRMIRFDLGSVQGDFSNRTGFS